MYIHVCKLRDDTTIVARMVKHAPRIKGWSSKVASHVCGIRMYMYSIHVSSRLCGQCKPWMMYYTCTHMPSPFVHPDTTCTCTHLCHIQCTCTCGVVLTPIPWAWTRYITCVCSIWCYTFWCACTCKQNRAPGDVKIKSTCIFVQAYLHVYTCTCVNTYTFTVFAVHLYIDNKHCTGAVNNL